MTLEVKPIIVRDTGNEIFDLDALSRIAKHVASKILHTENYSLFKVRPHPIIYNETEKHYTLYVSYDPKQLLPHDFESTMNRLHSHKS